jgi:hypothetical protein
MVIMKRFLLVVLSAAAVASCGAAEKSVSDAAREDVVGSAEVVHEVESGTSGATSLEVRYLVLDLGENDAVAAAATEAQRLTEAGWRIRAGQPPARHTGSSAEANAAAAVYTLADYLDSSHDDHVRSELREAVPDPAGLIVVAVEPRT